MTKKQWIWLGVGAVAVVGIYAFMHKRKTGRYFGSEFGADENADHEASKPALVKPIVKAPVKPAPAPSHLTQKKDVQGSASRADGFGKNPITSHDADNSVQSATVVSDMN